MTSIAQAAGATGYRLDYVDGRPRIVTTAGDVVSPAAYCDCILRRFDAWRDRNLQFVASGVHLYFLNVSHSWETLASPYWSADGVYPRPTPEQDAQDVDGQARAILAADPQARFFVRWTESVPKTWAARYPGHMQTSTTGERFDQFSLASEHGLQAFLRFSENIIQCCEGREWAERIVGYAYFPMGEGLTNLSCNGYTFDGCEAMQTAYRDFLRERYADTAALRAAWGDHDTDFDTLRVPTEEETRAERDALLHWPAPGAMQRQRDYYDLQVRLFRRWFCAIVETMRRATRARPALVGIDALKQPMLGWMLGMAFGRQSGVVDAMNQMPEMTLGSGAIAVGELLAHPDWDFLITPSDYTARSVGYGWESEGLNDSLRLHAKVMLVENDSRTWMGAESETQGAFRTPAEVQAGLLRNTAWALSRGHLLYWMNVGSNYFDDPRIHDLSIRAETRLLDASSDLPHRETEHAICLVLDDSGPLYENGTAGFQQIAALWQRQLGLAHCGVPYRVHLFSDLEHPDMPPYRAYLFPNLFELTPARMDLLRRQVLRAGNVAIFGPATGITDGHCLSADGISALLGVEMDLIPRQAPRRVLLHGQHPITANLPAAMSYGDSFPYGPILVPSRAAVDAGGFTTLGVATTVWQVNKPGLILVERDGCKLIWSVAAPLPAALIRECCRAAGCHIWCEEDDVILASDSIAAIHSVKAGPRTIHLPGPRQVRDLMSGEIIGDALTRIDLSITPPQTRLFQLSPPGTPR